MQCTISEALPQITANIKQEYARNYISSEEHKELYICRVKGQHSDYKVPSYLFFKLCQNPLPCFVLCRKGEQKREAQPTNSDNNYRTALEIHGNGLQQ